MTQTTRAEKAAEQEKVLADLKAKYRLGHQDDVAYKLVIPKGISEEVVRKISEYKDEPGWMTDIRLKALQHFQKRGLPKWGPWSEELMRIPFNDITYFAVATEGEQPWEELPNEIKQTFEKIGIPRGEQERLVSGSAAQYDSMVAYHEVQEKLTEQGVIFLSTDEALRQHPELVKKYFGTVIPSNDNFAAALNTAFWSGGSFLFVPSNTHVELPLSAYFRINASQFFQAERTLVIAEEGSRVSYSEGCVLPGEQISTGDTMVNVESLHPKDKVITQNGKLNSIRATMMREYSGNVLEITPLSPGNRFTLTPEHPVLSLSRDKVSTAKHFPDRRFAPIISKDIIKKIKPKYAPAHELEEGDFIVFPKILGKEIPTGYRTEALVLLGWYLAEGCTHCSEQGQKFTKFAFHIEETEYHKEVCGAIYKLSGRKASVRMRKEENTCEITSTHPVIYDLCLNNCFHMATQKYLSSKIMNAPLEEVSVILDRYQKGDGCVHSSYDLRKDPNNKYESTGTSSEKLAFQLQELLARQGHYAKITIRPANEHKIICGKVTRESKRYLLRYPLNPKRFQAYDQGDFFLVPIKKIASKFYIGPVFNLDVKSNPSYLTKGFVVHNCSAPSYKAKDSIHAAVVEIIAKPNAEVTYLTSQNWSTGMYGSGGVYNLVTKRAAAMEGATVKWIQGEVGSKLTVKFPSVYCLGRGARGEIHSMAFAGQGQQQDTGGKLILAAPDTSGVIVSKSITKDGGIASYRGLVEVGPKATGAKVKVVCDALLLDEHSVSNTWPTMRVDNDDVQIEHEATVSKVGEEQLFYLMSRGLSEEEAMKMIVNGFAEPVIGRLPMEYAVELVRLLEIQLEGSVG